MASRDTVSNTLLAILRGEVQPRRKSTTSRLATVVLLAVPDGDLVQAAVDGLVRERFPIDAQLVQDIYWSAPRGSRPSIAVAMGVTHVRASEYRAIWLDAYRSSRTNDDKVRLGQTLAGFLIRNPGQARHFAPAIRGLLADESEQVRNVGLLLLGTLPRVTGAEMQHVLRGLSRGTAATRVSALGALQRWLVRGDDIGEDVLSFVRSESVAAAARDARGHRDSAVRMGARNFLRILGRRNAAWGEHPGPRSP